MEKYISNLMPFNAPFLARCRGLLAAALCLATLSGCAENFKLVQFGITTIENGWYIMPIPRGPRTPVEEAVIKVAGTRRNAQVDNVDVLLIVSDGVMRYVDAVEKSEDPDWFVEKTITRYIVVDGKIAAKGETQSEIFPSVEFERAVLRDATLARSMMPVLSYDDGLRSVTMSSRPDTICSAKVRIFETGQADRTPKAVKLVNFCGLDALKTNVLKLAKN